MDDQTKRVADLLAAAHHLKDVADRPVFGCKYSTTEGPFAPAPIPARDVADLYEAACLVLETVDAIAPTTRTAGD